MLHHLTHSNIFGNVNIHIGMMTICKKVSNIHKTTLSRDLSDEYILPLIITYFIKYALLHIMCHSMYYKYTCVIAFPFT